MTDNAAAWRDALLRLVETQAPRLLRGRAHIDDPWVLDALESFQRILADYHAPRLSHPDAQMLARLSDTRGSVRAVLKRLGYMGGPRMTPPDLALLAHAPTFERALIGLQARLTARLKTLHRDAIAHFQDACARAGVPPKARNPAPLRTVYGVEGRRGADALDVCDSPATYRYLGHLNARPLTSEVAPLVWALSAVHRARRALLRLSPTAPARPIAALAVDHSLPLDRVHTTLSGAGEAQATHHLTVRAQRDPAGGWALDLHTDTLCSDLDARLARLGVISGTAQTPPWDTLNALMTALRTLAYARSPEVAHASASVSVRHMVAARDARLMDVLRRWPEPTLPAVAADYATAWVSADAAWLEWATLRLGLKAPGDLRAALRLAPGTARLLDALHTTHHTAHARQRAEVREDIAERVIPALSTWRDVPEIMPSLFLEAHHACATSSKRLMHDLEVCRARLYPAPEAAFLEYSATLRQTPHATHRRRTPPPDLSVRSCVVLEGDAFAFEIDRAPRHDIAMLRQTRCGFYPVPSADIDGAGW